MTQIRNIMSVKDPSVSTRVLFGKNCPAAHRQSKSSVCQSHGGRNIWKTKKYNLLMLLLHNDTLSLQTQQTAQQDWISKTKWGTRWQTSTLSVTNHLIFTSWVNENEASHICLWNILNPSLNSEWCKLVFLFFCSYLQRLCALNCWYSWMLMMLNERRIMSLKFWIFDAFRHVTLSQSSFLSSQYITCNYVLSACRYDSRYIMFRWELRLKEAWLDWLFI